MSRRLACTLMLLVLQMGCVRGGFDVAPDTGAGAQLDRTLHYDDFASPDGSLADHPDASWPDVPVPTHYVANRSHDTCASALEVDMAALASGPIFIAVDASGARADYGQGCAADLVLKLINTPANGQFRASCTDAAAGAMVLWTGAAGVCAGQWMSKMDLSCINLPLSFRVTSDPGYAIICRDPAAGAGIVRLDPM